MRQSFPQEALLQALHLCGTECADIQQDIERTARFEGESCMRESFKPPSREALWQALPLVKRETCRCTSVMPPHHEVWWNHCNVMERRTSKRKASKCSLRLSFMWTSRSNHLRRRRGWKMMELAMAHREHLSRAGCARHLSSILQRDAV